MSSLTKIFNEYDFDTSSNESEASLSIPPLSNRATEQDYAPLTVDRLQKKDKLDLLLFNKHRIQRRRSICCGNIYRHLYNHDNSPMTLLKPIKRKDSNNSNASVNSQHLASTSGFLKDTQSIDSSRGRTLIENAPTVSLHETNFSGLVKLSSDYMIAIKKSRKETFTLLSKVTAVASRVVDIRNSEPKDTRMAINEVTSLAKYLYDLKSSPENTAEAQQIPECSMHHPGIIISNASDSSSFSETDRLLSSSTSSYSSIPSTKKVSNPFSTFIKYFYSQYTLQQQLHKHIRFEGWSLFYFSPNSLTRYYLWKIIGSRGLEICIFALLIIQWIILSFAHIRFDKSKPLFSSFADYLILFINLIYTLEAGSKIIVYGFLFSCPEDISLKKWMTHRNDRRTSIFSIKEDEYMTHTQCHTRPISSASSINTCTTHPSTVCAENQVIASLTPDDEYLKINHTCYLSNVSNIIDLISIVSYWIDIIMILCFNKVPWSVFQALAAMRLFRFLIITEGTAVIMKSLRSSYNMLKNVFGFFVFFWLLFSLVALFIFTNSFNRRCAVMPDRPLEKNMTDIEFIEPRISCSGYMINNTTRMGVFDIDMGLQYQQTENGLFCKLGQVCIQGKLNQPGYHHISFQNIFYAMLNIMTVISTEDWTDLMYTSQDSISNVGSALFYCACIYLMTFIMVPMFIAVITTSFSRVRGDMRQSAFSLKPKVLIASKTHHLKNDEEEWIYVDHGNRMQNTYSIVKSTWFSYTGSILVLVQMISMTFYHSNVSLQAKERLDKMHSIFTIIFLIEILIRICGYCDWGKFWNTTRNRVDLFIVIMTIVDEFPVIKNSKYHIYLLIFPILRSYRVAYLFPGVLKLLSDAIGNGQGIINLTFFTFLVLSLLSPISVQLFGGDFNFVEEDEPSMRFDNWYQGFLAIFQIMTGENWTDILYASMHSQEHASVTCAAVFIVFLYFAVHYMVLNLFIAVIMENFDLDEEDIKQIQIKKYILKHQWKPEYFKMDNISRFLLPLFIIQEKQKINVKSLPPTMVANVTASKFKKFLSEPSIVLPQKRPIYNRRLHKRSSSIISQFSVKSLLIDPIAYKTTHEEPLAKYNDEYELNLSRENKAVIVSNLGLFRPFGVLQQDHKILKWCTYIKNLRLYNWSIFACICVSTLLAMWEEEYNRSRYPMVTAKLIEPLQTVLLVVYWLDVLVHMAADGIFMLPKSYLRNAWNFLDMMDLIAQVIFTIKYEPSYLRVLRTLRSTRLVYYVQGMRAIFSDLIRGLPKMIDAVTLNILVFVPFAIYGCYLFSGKFSLCNDATATSMYNCYHEFKSTEDENMNILLPRVWKNPYDYSFDSFGESILHLFECASGEGWIMSLFSAMSVPENPTDQAKFSWSTSSILHSLFYVVFMFVASLCSIQLFIGVFLEIFKQRSGIFALTNTQRQYRDLLRQLALVKPSLKAERPNGTIRALFYDLVINKRGTFARFMVAVLTMNIIVFATEHSHQPYWLTELQNILNSIFLCFYVFEMAAKIAGLGFYKWASARWNIYDFVLVGLTIATTVAKFYIDLSFGWNIARKLFLVGIVFRLAQRNELLDTLFRSVKRALPSIFYVSTVFAIVIICFGVTFQEKFSSTRYGPYGNEHANFRSLFTTILTLFRITTGENWDFLMHDFTFLPPDCVGKEDCGSPYYAIILFISFYVICTYIFVNLFIAIVIDNFSFMFDTRNQFSLITRTDLRWFKVAWSEIDPTASGYIRIEDVPQFLRSLNGALSVRIYENQYSIEKLLDASYQLDNNPNHLIVVPLSEYQQTSNNMINERFFNIYQLNQTLADIDPFTIRERKRQYTLIYQEIINSASHRGVKFCDMLEILAIQLVDISKSLTFDELVKRARIQDKIANDLATNKAKGLIDMLIQRREFLKARGKSRIKREKSSRQLFGKWLVPVSDNSRSHAPSRTQSLCKTTRENVPKIVIHESPENSVDDSLSTFKNQENEKHHTLSIDIPITLESATTNSDISCNSPLSSSGSSVLLDFLTQKSLDNLKFSPGISKVPPVCDSVFTRYYTSSGAIDKMTSSDAKKIVNELQKTIWSDILNHESSDDDEK